MEKEKYYLIQKVSDGWFKSHYEMVLLSKKTESSLEYSINSKRVWIRDGAVFSIIDNDIYVER